MHSDNIEKAVYFGQSCEKRSLKILYGQIVKVEAAKIGVYSIYIPKW
jgi:hypothetical protein